MKLTATCKSCKIPNPIKSMAMTRPDLAMDKGEEFNLNCKSCGVNSIVHVNQVKVSSSPIPIVIGVIVSLILTLVLLRVGWIAAATFVIPVYIWRQQQASESAWNRYRL